MSVERLDTLERGLIRLESTMGNLTEKMGDMATNMGEITKAITTLAVVDVHVKDLGRSIDRVADSHRALCAKVELLDSEHSVKHSDVLASADTSGWRRFMLAVGVMGSIFGYLYLDLRADRDSIDEISNDISKLEVSVAAAEGHHKLIEEKLKNANGHRHYLKLEGLDTIKQYIKESRDNRDSK